MWKHLAGILAILLGLLGLFVYAIRPVGSVVLQTTNILEKSGGYEIEGILVNKSTTTLLLAEKDGAPELATAIQTGPGSFVMTKRITGPHTFTLPAGATQTFRVFLATNSDCLIYAHFSGGGERSESFKTPLAGSPGPGQRGPLTLRLFTSNSLVRKSSSGWSRQRSHSCIPLPLESDERLVASAVFKTAVGVLTR